jgi:hypothetical protein
MQDKHIMTRQGVEMNTNQLRFAVAGLSFLLILLSGFWLSRSGKPYGTIVFSIHKLVAVATVVLLGVTIYRINRVGTLSAIELLAPIVTGLFFLGTMVTGGLLSIPIDKPMPAIRAQAAPGNTLPDCTLYCRDLVLSSRSIKWPAGR